ncbi:MAG: hypothetical protein LBT53_02475, partial [Puniceicoccales bacterium]|nr:hypothetical protein [Puniceicoccales bacterium]
PAAPPVAVAVTPPVAPAPAPAAALPPPDPKKFLFAAKLPNFSRKAYHAAVADLMDAFERKTRRALKPGLRQKVGLKIYTASGPGIATPKHVVRAVVAALEQRGFLRENIYLVDLQEKTLRECGYLAPLRAGASAWGTETFEGCPVLPLDADGGTHYSSRHFYENPLPSKEIFVRQGDFAAATNTDDRRSYIPALLYYQMDFWLNLPVALDSAALGVCGALGNATIWSISNQRRFLDNAENAQKAAVEIAAAPEFQSTLAFNLISLERYQYVGGPLFDSNYCLSEKRLWLSANPMILDHLLWQRINFAREKRGFPKLEPEPRMFISGNTPPTQLGSCRPAELEFIRVN